MQTDNEAGERRRFFRIDDDICLEYHLLSDEEYRAAPEMLEQSNHSAFTLSAEFATLNNNFHPMLNSIKHSSPEIAQYLELLDNKIDALSQHLLTDELPCSESDMYRANLSASGIAFNCAESIAVGTKLKLKLILLPEKIGILVFGTVKNCGNNQDNTFHIGVDFEHIRYEDQELMIKHNLNKQMLDLRERAESNQDE